MTTPTRRKTTSPVAPAGKLVRLSVNMNQDTAEALKEIADEAGISLTEAVRRAISVYKFVEDEIDKGRHVQTADEKGGNVRELVLM